MPDDGLLAGQVAHLLLSCACAHPLTRLELRARLCERHCVLPHENWVTTCLTRLTDFGFLARTGVSRATRYTLTPAGEARLDELHDDLAFLALDLDLGAA